MSNKIIINEYITLYYNFNDMYTIHFNNISLGIVVTYIDNVAHFNRGINIDLDSNFPAFKILNSTIIPEYVDKYVIAQGDGATIIGMVDNHFFTQYKGGFIISDFKKNETHILIYHDIRYIFRTNNDHYIFIMNTGEYHLYNIYYKKTIKVSKIVINSYKNFYILNDKENNLIHIYNYNNEFQKTIKHDTYCVCNKYFISDEIGYYFYQSESMTINSKNNHYRLRNNLYNMQIC